MAKSVKIQSKSSSPLHMFEVQVLSNGNNVALEGTSSQSSTFMNRDKYAASRANDGDNSTFCHTNSESNPWWEIELKESFEVDSITVFNRYCGADSTDSPGCLCRLSNAIIELYDESNSLVASSSLDDTCGQVFISKVFSCESVTPSPTVSGSPSQSPHAFSTAVSAKRVKIQSKTSTPLHMFEVQVLSNGNNVALEGTSSQSSTFMNRDKYAASRANDGDNSTFCHTNSESNPWWEIELKETFEVDNIVILNRWCGSEADPYDCLCRLSHSTIMLFNENDSTVYTQEIGDTCNQVIIVENLSESASTTSSSYTVRLESTTGQQLHIFELQAFSGGVNVALEGSAAQSSTFKNNDRFAAYNAIDGDTTTFSHTNDSNAWWEVELQADVIESVTIFNRWCGDESDIHGCLCRLSFARVVVIQDGEVVATKTLGDTCNQLIVSESFTEIV